MTRILGKQRKDDAKISVKQLQIDLESKKEVSVKEQVGNHSYKIPKLLKFKH